MSWKGTVVTERDRVALYAIAMARYLTSKQVAAVAFSAKTGTVDPGFEMRVRQARRRCGKMAEAGHLPPLIRPVLHRGPDGMPCRAWALTDYGYDLAKEAVPHAVKCLSDVGPAFMEHTLSLNDVFVRLVLRLVPAPAPPLGRPIATMPFRWLCESNESIEFEWYSPATKSLEKAAFKPDAMLEMPEAGKRVFVERETGAQTLVSTDPRNNGATIGKLRTYEAFLRGGLSVHDATTPYARRYRGDGRHLEPEVMFVVNGVVRRDAIRTLVADTRRGVAIPVRAYTLEEADGPLSALVSGRGVAAAPVSVMEAPAAVLAATDVALLSRTLHAFRDVLDDVRKRLESHNRAEIKAGRRAGFALPCNPDTTREALALVARLQRADGKRRELDARSAGGAAARPAASVRSAAAPPPSPAAQSPRRAS